MNDTSTNQIPRAVHSLVQGGSKETRMEAGERLGGNVSEPTSRTSEAANRGNASRPKTRKCKAPGCSNSFTPYVGFQTWCSNDCGVILATAKLKKEKRQEELKERRKDRSAREQMKTRNEWIAGAQVAFNAFIRLRDQIAGHRCISSGKPLDWSGNNVDAGHYRSRGSAPHLRFDERNCHAQTKQENRYASGNVVDYRIGLIQRIGLEAVEALEADQTSRKYSIDDLKAIKKHYADLVKQLKTNL